MDINLSITKLNSIDLSGINEKLPPQVTKYFALNAGEEHYRLLAYLSTLVSKAKILDVGTYQGVSAAALSYSEDNRVITIDTTIDDNLSLVKFDNIDFLNCSAMDPVIQLNDYSIIMLDIDHSGNTEKLFTDKLVNTKWSGVLIADDIHLNRNMESWWDSLKMEKYDITKYGHWSGTGLAVLNNTNVRVNLL